MLNKKTVNDLKDIAGKKVLVRCDFNVPLKQGGHSGGSLCCFGRE